MQQTKDIDNLFSESHDRNYTSGQIILYQGENANNIFLIREGHVKVYDINSKADEKLLLILGPGDLFPLIWLFDSSAPMHYFYETLDDVCVSVVNKEEVIKKLETSHEITLHMLKYYVDKTNEIMSRIECIEATSAKHKVAQVLLYLAKSHGDLIAEEAYKVRIPTTHQMIANMSGLNRSTASIQLKELADEKIYKETASVGLIVHTDRLETFIETE